MYPALHAQAMLPAGELVFSGHVKHDARESAPSANEYVPFGHISQASEPIACLYCPCKQAWHGPPSAPVYPCLHLQSDSDELPASEFEFAGQVSTQRAVPASSLYFPIGHSSHGPPLGPKDPGAHRREQVSLEVLPGGEVCEFPSSSSGH